MYLFLLLSSNFIFYITYVQFGLIKLLEHRSGLGMDALSPLLLIMAVTGATASVLTGYAIDRYSISLRNYLKIASIISIMEGLCAIYSLMSSEPIPALFFACIGLLMGTGGILLIRSAAAWRPENRGINAGFVMATVYLIANIIAYYDTPEWTAVVNGILVSAVGLGYILHGDDIEIKVYSDNSPSVRNSIYPSQNMGHVSLSRVIALLSIFVIVDTILFHTETIRPEISKYTWDGRWLWNGIVHAVSAIIAGLTFDKKGAEKVFRSVIFLFSPSLLILIFFQPGVITGLISTIFYNTAVSFYGILLLVIWYVTDTKLSIGLRIGIGMSITGWIASPLGIAIAGAADDMNASTLFLLLFSAIILSVIILSTGNKQTEQDKADLEKC